MHAERAARALPRRAWEREMAGELPNRAKNLELTGTIKPLE